MCAVCNALGINLHQAEAIQAAPGGALSGIAPGSTISALPFLLEDFAGQATWAGKPIFNHDQVINQIDIGIGVMLNPKNGVITYSFARKATGLYHKEGFPEPDGFSPFSPEQEAAARDAIQLWDDLIPQTFVEKKGQGAHILFANTTTGPATAWAYYPSEDKPWKQIGTDIWTADPSVNWNNSWLQLGGSGRATLVHELGHTLGLSHPGAYNGGDDADGDGEPDPITYANDAEYAQDTKQYSIMSYFSGEESGAHAINVSLAIPNNPQTPLLHDILTIQAKYGADPTTRTGDTVYFANSNAGNPVYDLEKNPFPYLSVYDAGGEDTFDFSTANTGVFIDLRPGAFSSATAGYETLEEAIAAVKVLDPANPGWTEADYASWINTIMTIGADWVAADTGISGVTATSHRNISIAYNTIIENANGGSARDYLVGNDVSNKLNGNGGNDVLNGLGGDDFLTGGDGADEFRFFQNSGNDSIIDFASGVDKIHLVEIDANTGVAGNQAFTFIGDAAFSAAGQLRAYTDGTNHFVAGDTNGDGVADFTINLGSASVAASDFFL